MITWTLLHKILRDGAALLAACMGSIFLFAWIRVWIVASMETEQFSRIARNLPELVQRLLPVSIDQFVTYPGLVSFTYEEPVAYLIMTVWAVARASDAISGEIGRGTMEMILSQPVSRARYLKLHSGSTLCGVILIAFAAWLGTWFGIHTATVKVGPPSRGWSIPFLRWQVEAKQTRESTADVPRKPLAQFVQARVLMPATINYACLGVFLTGLTTAFSSIGRFRGRTIGIVIGIYLVETVIELTGLAVERFAWLLRCTFFSAYEPVAISTEVSRNPQFAWQFFVENSANQMPQLGPLGCDLMLIVLGSLGLLVGTTIFCRRDLPAPL